VPAIPHLCCRDRNLNALRSLLLGAHAEGIRRVLCITGDPLPEGVGMDVKPVFNLSSRGLLEMVAEMDRSVFEKNPLVAGAAVGIHLPNRKAELAKTARKVEAGAGFLMTQPVFAGASADFTAELARTFSVPVHVGLLPPVGLRNALFLHNEVPGISLPDDVIARFRTDMSREEAEEAGLEAALAGARACGPGVGGYFLVTPFSRFGLMVRLIQRLRDEGLASG
jgi:methionine synthase / methylenetetrahydrofolate reductase(NADPH)